jgi:hypothetical protein
MLNLFAVTLVDIGIAGILVGTVSIVRPLRVLGVHSRLMAIAVIGSAVVLILAGMFTPAPLHTVAAAESDLDRAMPSWQFDEHHAIRINASPERVYRAVKDTTAGEILFFGALVWIRRLNRSGPESILNAPAQRPLLDVATRTTFATLTDTQHEIVIGTVVVAPPGVRRARQPTPEELLLVQRRDGFAVATLNFAVSDRGGGVCDLTTTTRVFATDRLSKLAFGAYWRVIYPGSSLIRYMWLRAIKQRAEAPV